MQFDSECPVVTSDASGSWVWGAWHGSHWFQHEWSIEEVINNISLKELVPVIVSAVVWGSDWVVQSVTSYSDNQAVVLNKHSCRDKFLMHLLKCLSYFEGCYQFVV